MTGGPDDQPRLTAVIERQRRELAEMRARAGEAGLLAMARGALMERHRVSAATAARQLADMATAAGLSLAEMAAAVLGQPAPEANGTRRQPPGGAAAGPPLGPAQPPPQTADLLLVARADLADNGTELTGVLAGQWRDRYGVAAVAVWLLGADGALDLFGQDGLDGITSSRWRRLPPQLDCPEQRAVVKGEALWRPAGPGSGDLAPAIAPWGRRAARALLPLRDRSGTVLGVVEAWWREPRADFGDQTRAGLTAAVAGFAEVLVPRSSHGTPLPAAGPVPLFAMLDAIAESALVARPARGPGGEVTDFSIAHLSPGFADPAGRPAAELAGLTLLTAYPASASCDGLFARAVRVLASGRAEHAPGLVGAPLTGESDAVAAADLRVAPFFDSVVITWRTVASGERLAGLLNHAQRLGQLGGWEENLRTGAVRWTDTAYTLFGLDPRQAVPIPIAHLHSFVIAADRQVVRRFRQALLRQREPGVAVFRIVRPEDSAIRQIRIFAEPVLAGDEVAALRGAFQDVSAQYRTQVALNATRDQLADSEQRAAQEHQLALRLQRAIMPEDEPPVEATGVEVAVRYRPAEPGHLVAGDWYDALTLPDDKGLLLVVGDITGHGIDAVTGMVAARNALRGLAGTGAGPAGLLRHLNYAACHLTEGIAGTVVCGVYDPDTRLLRWARAGHLPPILVRDGTASMLPLPDGMLLGLDPNAAYEEATFQLLPGDILLLFTDGLIERRAGSITDALRDLTGAAAPAAETAAAEADRILAAALSDTGDDACLVTVRIT